MDLQKKRFAAALLPFLVVAVLATLAQAPKEVPVAEEPRHHFAFENDAVRAFRVEVAPHDQTMLHRHDRDYFYISIGRADIVNAVQSRPEITAHLADLQVGFAKGGFAHVAKNRGNTPFRNFTIEFKRPQTQLTNGCAQIDPAQPANCPAPVPGASFSAPQFETADVRVALLNIPPRSRLNVADAKLPRLLMRIDKVTLDYISSGSDKCKFVKEMWCEGSNFLIVANREKSPARLLSVAIKQN